MSARLGNERNVRMLPTQASLNKVASMNDICAEWTERFRASQTSWFRARTHAEYSGVAEWCRKTVDFDNARMLDFGCGALPVAAASFALRHPNASVTGTDIVPISRDKLSRTLTKEVGTAAPPNLKFVMEDGERFDLVYSWAVFEHIAEGEVRACFAKIRDCLAEDGVFLFQVGGLYHSSEGGSHLKSFFPSLPWHHLILSIDELHRGVFGSADPSEDRKKRAWQQFIELNRLTAEDYLEAARSAGLKLVRKELFRTKASPPARLLRVYTKDTLTLNGIRILFKRG